MTSPASELEQALAAYRREHGSAYLRALAGEPLDPRVDARFRNRLLGERGRDWFEAARSSGELDEAALAATGAHYARAALEQGYARARATVSGLLAREVSVEGETRALGALIGEWLGTSSPAQRDRLVRAMGPELIAVATDLVARRSDGEFAAGELIAQLAVARHPDAGPTTGAREQAESWLEGSAELTREALGFAQRALGMEGHAGLDHLWLVLGQEFRGLFPREGRLRRLAEDWEPLGLRRLLSARARAAREHAGPFVAPHLIVLSAPREVRLSEAAREYGLASELASAEAIGRAVGLVHGSEGLPFALRFPAVGSVARAVGSLAVQRLLSPEFLRRARGLSAREAELIARLSSAWFLIDSRLAAAAALARGLRGPSAIDEAAALAERALLGPVPTAAALLVLRASPGGPFRAKSHGPALAWVLREAFDADWYRNPRAAEPLRGALARAGAFSIEQFAEELGTSVERGIGKLSELF